MINWILGAIIVGVTGFIIVRTIGRLRRGESTCCGGRDKSECGCDCDCSK
ncbi:MAG TPA: hypothetical protein VN456_10135 [Desulfosporosinus sp.]|nr:hypothetical protein [Desulfosporosinus sp.]